MKEKKVRRIRHSEASIPFRRKKKENKVRFVRKANMWCATSWEEDKQKVNWFSTKEEAEKFLKDL